MPLSELFVSTTGVDGRRIASAVCFLTMHTHEDESGDVHVAIRTPYFAVTADEVHSIA